MSLALCLLETGVRNQVCFLQTAFSGSHRPELGYEGETWSLPSFSSWLQASKRRVAPELSPIAQSLVSCRAGFYGAKPSPWQHGVRQPKRQALPEDRASRRSQEAGDGEGEAGDGERDSLACIWAMRS